MTLVPPTAFIGPDDLDDRDLRRVEDPHLLRGETTYVGNLDLPGVATVHYVTSPYARATITSIDVEEASASPGVLAVVTAADLRTAGYGWVPGLPPGIPEATERFVLAEGEVRFVGEPIVAIVAETEAAAADAAEAVWIDYEPATPVIGFDAALAADEAVFADVPDNVVSTAAGGTDTEFDHADYDISVTDTFHNQRLAPCPMETRTAAAWWTEDGRLVQHASCQGVHPQRAMLAAWYGPVLGITKDDIRVTTADVGGSFGAKARMYPEELLLGHLAKLVGRPVRFAPTRSADMVGLGHSRAHRQEVTVSGDADGTIRALEITITADAGAYPVAAPHMSRNAGVMTPGPYAVDHLRWTSRALLTNTTPIVAYRGAGRPESGAMLDRAVDRFAHACGLDPLEVRARNLVPGDAMPHTNPNGVFYDSGDFGEALALVADKAGWSDLRATQAAERAAGARLRTGIGLSTFIDRTAGVPGSEYGGIELQADGSVRVRTGSSPYGQGHYTTWKQLVADRTGIAPERIEVIHGDTDVVPRGGITGGSRSAQKAGSAVVQATEQLIDEARQRAADLLEAAVADVVVDVSRGCFHVAGAPGASTVGWAEVAAAAVADDGDADAIAFACETDYDTDGPSVPYGAYVAVVRVDLDTGEVIVDRIVSVDDAGTIINPMIVRGQVHGGIGQGLGQALCEEFVYDAEGNPLTANFMDYAVPSAAEMPSFESYLTESPSPQNLLGAKGIAESGTIGAVPAIQNAVIDAVADLGVTHIDLPVSAQRVWQAVHDAETAASEAGTGS